MDIYVSIIIRTHRYIYTQPRLCVAEVPALVCSGSHPNRGDAAFRPRFIRLRRAAFRIGRAAGGSIYTASICSAATHVALQLVVERRTHRHAATLIARHVATTGGSALQRCNASRRVATAARCNAPLRVGGDAPAARGTPSRSTARAGTSRACLQERSECAEGVLRVPPREYSEYPEGVLRGSTQSTPREYSEGVL